MWLHFSLHITLGNANTPAKFTPVVLLSHVFALKICMLMCCNHLSHHVFSLSSLQVVGLSILPSPPTSRRSTDYLVKFFINDVWRWLLMRSGKLGSYWINNCLHLFQRPSLCLLLSTTCFISSFVPQNICLWLDQNKKGTSANGKQLCFYRITEQLLHSHFNYFKNRSISPYQPQEILCCSIK